MKVKIRDVLTLGFALFALFFGAGNVIFPPFLGMQTAPNWLPAIFAYLLVDIVIAIFSIIVMAKNDEGLTGITQRIGGFPSRIVGIAIILCIGPLICVPRSAAVAYDLLMVPIFDFPNNGIEQVIFSFIFILIAWLLVVRPTKIVDIVGIILTPLLLVALTVIIIKGIIVPPGIESTYPILTNAVGVGIVAGYQSMDLLGALSFGSVMITSAFVKGYKTPKQRIKVLTCSSILSMILLFVASIGMAYLGSVVSLEFSSITSQAVLVARIAGKMFSFGSILIGILGSLACLTTAIGLISGTAAYFKDMIEAWKKKMNPKKSNNKNLYISLCTVTCVVSFLISNLGLELIIECTSPILTLIFPMIVVLVILSWFNLRIKSNRVYIFAALFAFVSNLLVVANEWIHLPFIDFLPFTDMQLGWVLPVLVGIVIGFIVGRGHDDRQKLKIWSNEVKYNKDFLGHNKSKKSKIVAC